jgi:PAS domain S-box-containing protein
MSVHRESDAVQPPSSAEFMAEIQQLRRQVDNLAQENSDLTIALETTSQHGDLVEAQLHAANQRLRAEVAERQLAQATLQDILEKVTRDKTDLEMILKATAEHGDMVEYQLYTQAVETMRQSEELFRAISEATPILMVLTQRPNGTITYANSTSQQRLGLTADRLAGQSLAAFFADEADAQYLQNQVNLQGYVNSYEMQLQQQSGERFWVSASVHQLTLAATPTLLTTFYDISDRKQAEAALQDSQAQLQHQARELAELVKQRSAQLQQAEDKYRIIYENAAEGLFQISTQGTYLSGNPALAALYGYKSATEMIAAVPHVRQIYVEPSRWGEIQAYLRRFTAASGFESQAYRQDGSVIWISENLRTVVDQTGELQYYEGSVREITSHKQAEGELRQQRKISEQLLLNVLPQAVAERLKRGQSNIADSFAQATVLFSDIVNFTGIAAEASPGEVVQLLNAIFSSFDRLADRHDLEKVKTIGDSYMAVGGVPQERPDHLQAIAELALDMQTAITQFRTPKGQAIQLRIGLHTGPVVAGIVGSRKFIYDLWGNTVNIASRMESQGEAGQIQVSDRVFQHLSNRYVLAPRGKIEVKGIGPMNTYWLMGRQSTVSYRSDGESDR